MPWKYENLQLRAAESDKLAYKIWQKFATENWSVNYIKSQRFCNAETERTSHAEIVDICVQLLEHSAKLFVDLSNLMRTIGR